MTKISKIILFLSIAFFYFFSGSLITRLLYPLECRGFFLILFGKQYSVIDLNIPHLIAFIFMGIVFKGWACLFSVFSEALQVIIKHSEFSFVDMALNLIGSTIGILLLKLRHK